MCDMSCASPRVYQIIIVLSVFRVLLSCFGYVTGLIIVFLGVFRMLLSCYLLRSSNRWVLLSFFGCVSDVIIVVWVCSVFYCLVLGVFCGVISVLSMTLF